MENKIIRFFDTELRASETDNKDMEVFGYALKFQNETTIGGKYGWRETINRNSLVVAKLDNVVLNFNHNMDSILAATRNNSLELIVDNIGLQIKAKIIDTALGRDVYKLIQDGLINRMSFAATIRKDLWTESENDLDLREIVEFERFYDVSCVTFPAYDQTSISARSVEEVTYQKRIYDKQIKKLNNIIGGNK